MTLKYSAKSRSHESHQSLLAIDAAPSKKEVIEEHLLIHDEDKMPDNAATKLVTRMIDGMVHVLHEEDVSDEHKKAWCANETQTIAALEAEKKDIIQQTSAELEQQEDEIATVKEELKDLKFKTAELDKVVHESTEQRKKEHQEFVDAFATKATAIKLVKKAMTMLDKVFNPEKFCKEKKAAEDAALKKAGLALIHQSTDSPGAKRMMNALLPGGFDGFLQIRSRAAVQPVEVRDCRRSSFLQSKAGDVFGMMQDMITDLKTDMTESETEEKFLSTGGGGGGGYVQIMDDAQTTRSQFVKSTNQKQSTLAQLDEKRMGNKERLANTEEEYQNVQLYSARLQAECRHLMDNYEARHESRVENEHGLESTETIVTGGTPPSYEEVEHRYEIEHTKADVHKDFAGEGYDPDKPGTKSATWDVDM